MPVSTVFFIVSDTCKGSELGEAFREEMEKECERSKGTQKVATFVLAAFSAPLDFSCRRDDALSMRSFCRFPLGTAFFIFFGDGGRLWCLSSPSSSSSSSSSLEGGQSGHAKGTKKVLVLPG